MAAIIVSRTTGLPLTEGGVQWLGKSWHAESVVAHKAGELWARESERDTSDPRRRVGEREDVTQDRIDFLRGPLLVNYPYFRSGILRPGQPTWTTK